MWSSALARWRKPAIWQISGLRFCSVAAVSSNAVRGNIHTLLSKSVDAGLLRRSTNDDGEYVYQPGPNLPSTGVNIDSVHATRPARATVYLDPSEIQICNDPLPAGRALPVPGRDARCRRRAR